MKSVELEILKNAVELQGQLGFKRISPKRKGSHSTSSNWLSIRMDSKNRTSLAFSFDMELLKKEGWLGEKLRTNITSNGKVIIFEYDKNGDYALSGEQNTSRIECKISWQPEICKEPKEKNKYDIQYIPMNSKGVKRLVVSLPNELQSD